MLSHLNRCWRVVSQSNGKSEKRKVKQSWKRRHEEVWAGDLLPTHGTFIKHLFAGVSSHYTHMPHKPMPQDNMHCFLVYTDARIFTIRPPLHAIHWKQPMEQAPLCTTSTWMYSRNTREGAPGHTHIHTQRLCQSLWHLLADTRTKMSCRRVIK